MQPEPNPPAQSARYDGVSDWYDERLAVPFRADGAQIIERLLGAGPGRCIDLCCGTGIHFEALTSLGWDVTAVDVSTDQLRLAASRAAGRPVKLVEGDAASLPFGDRSFDAVVSFFSHTDVDDFAAVVREAARALEPDGVLLYVGIHPCFVGPHAERGERGRAVPLLYPGYGQAGRYSEAPGILPDGLWSRVTGVHLPLGMLLQTFPAAGLVIDRFEEHGDEDYPRVIVVRARKR